MDVNVSEGFERLLRDTTRLSFPVFASEGKKREQIYITKQRFDEKILSMLSLDDPDRLRARMADLWEAAERSAQGEFDTLPERLRINSFYLQEVMHQYIELIISSLSE